MKLRDSHVRRNVQSVQDFHAGAWYVAVAKVGGTLVVLLGGSAVFFVVYPLLIAWALIGPRRGVEAMTLSWLLGSLNPEIYSTPELTELLRWLVILAAFWSGSYSLLRKKRVLLRSWFAILAFVFVAGVLSISTSYAPDVSLFKLLTFLLAASAVLFCFHATRHLANYWHVWFLTVFTVVLLMSLPLIGHPIGYARNQQGFQGLTAHPQTYVIFIAPFLAWLVALLLSRRIKARAWWGVVGVAIISLFATQGRTGVLACVLGLTVSIFLKYGSDANLRRRLKRWLPGAMAAMIILLIAGLFSGDKLLTSIENFALKGQGDGPVSEAFEASRGFLIKNSLENFSSHPLVGIGFGVATDSSTFIVRRDPLFGIPISAPVEKGFIVSSVLEEVGLIGFIFLMILVWNLLAPTVRKGTGLAPFALAITALLVNFGEAVFFALSGMGLLIWLLIGAAQVMVQKDSEKCGH